MGERTTISWCDHTFNPWWGCVEVSPACDHCYARDFAHRTSPGLWGHEASRRFFGDRHWTEPLRWSRRAEAAGQRRRVFCASMADVLEERDDVVGRELDQTRQRLWSTIAGTPALDWLLLTKRPQNYRRLVPAEILARPNVWPGTTVESADYTWRADALLNLDCAGPRWVSYEPTLGPLSAIPGIAWYIVGGESGPIHRPMDPAWIEGLLEGCRRYGAALFVKQDSGRWPGKQGRIADALWVQEFPRQ
ncbi:MAG TPA: DUF5131 family protein [Candidatus Methylomirabilis sp.]|nr:DUF5131 family protein [Candidatus Methylomirabilis sp.]